MADIAKRLANRMGATFVSRAEVKGPNAMSDTMKDLIARIEAGSAGEQRELLDKAWRMLRGSEYERTGFNHYYRFKDTLDAEAYLSAAEMLVPEGMRCRLYILEDGRGAAWVYEPGDLTNPWAYNRATPALAICAAALKARMV